MGEAARPRFVPENSVFARVATELIARSGPPVACDAEGGYLSFTTMAAKPSAPAPTSQAANPNAARDAFIDDIYRDPAKHKAEFLARARKDSPHMTDAQLEASWQQMSEMLGLE